MFHYFNNFAIQMTKSQALSASHSGACDDDVAELLKLPAIRRQLAKIPDINLRMELREYGAWDNEQLQDRAANNARIIWIAAGNIRDGLSRNSRN